MKTLKNGNASRRILRSLLALLFVFALLSPDLAQTAAAVSQSDIDKLQSDADDLAGQKKQLQEKLSALADDKATVLEKKNLLDQQISVLSSQIANAESQISDYEDLITQTEAELTDAEAKEEAQHTLFCQRVRAMEERGTISYWAVLFKANSFTDLLSSLDYINEIMDSDQRVIDTLKALQDEIATKKADLETDKAAVESQQADLISRKSELDSQRTAANKLALQIDQNEDEYQDTLDEIAAEEEAIQNKIVELSKQLAAEQGNTTVTYGGYIWPETASKRVTSPFGKRTSPGGVGSTNHKGIDIGGVGYTTQIRAAKAGTVIVSQYSSSYGNYVVVSHGSGNTTLYAHMSSRSVNVGDKVSQGQALGITGSTGHSTGPHLHFEITENGVRVDPLKYLTDYIKAW